MDGRTEKGRGALMTHHHSLRSLLIMQNILPALRPILTGVEYYRVDGKEDNVAQVDEFIKILLTKEFRHFETFCTILANNGYEHWAKTLREEVREKVDISSKGPCAPAAPPLSTKRPALKDLVSYVIPRVASEWYNVGLQLDLEPYVLNELENKDHQPRRMFDKWLQGPACSWQSILDAVEKACGRGPMEDILADVLESIASAQSTANPEEDNRTPNGPANKTSSEQLLLPPSDIMPLKSMPCELQVISSVKKDNKLYITAIGKAQDKDSKDDVPKDHVSRQIQVYSLDGKGNWSTLPEDPRQKPAPNYNAPVTIINGRIALVGGRDAETDEITNVLSTWDEEKHEWENDNPPSMPTKRLTSGVCHRDNLLLVVGGVVDDKARMLVNTVDVYDFSSNRWYTPKALDLPIPQLRSPNIVVFKEYVYIIGGATAYPVPPCEAQYNRHAWRALWSDVKEAVSKAGAAVIQGAHTRGAEGEPSKEVERVWKRIADPPVLRPTVVCYDDFLMAVGGVQGGTPQEGIYKFMDGKNADSCGSWRLVGNMSVGRYRHAVVPLGSRGTAALFVAGGYVLDNPEGDETIIKSSSVEIVIL